MTENKEETITYGAGRFVIDIPASMQFAGSYSIQGTDVIETVWPEGDSDTHAQTAWRGRLDQINTIEPPDLKDETIIELKELPGIGRWCKAVLFYHKPISQNTVSLHLLVQFGKNGLWLKDRDIRSSARDIAYEISTDLARAYRPPFENENRVAVLPDRDSFYLRYGAIDLPFEYDESVKILFRHHPLDDIMVLDVETDVVQQVEQHGLMDRLAAVILTKFVPGLKIKKIRTRKRTVAGMRGEEVVYRGIEDDGDSGLYFAWEYPGQPNSAHFPNIQIGLRARDDNLEEKLVLWDAVLDSMRPAGR